VQGNFEGKGLYFWANGDIYIGEFKNNLSNGEGVYISQEGDWLYFG